jgi:hypothetical protein
LVTLIVVTSIAASDNNGIRIEAITAGLSRDSLVVSARFENLFSEKIIGTIKSGLPSIVQIEMRLLESGSKMIVRRQIVHNIAYDIWEERYTISNGKKLVLQSFEAVQISATHLKEIHLSEVMRLRPGIDYSVQMRVGIIPISSMQANRVSDWLRDPHQTEESVASDDRDSGFQLNLNKLVSFFVNRNKKSAYTSAWYSSGIFKLDDLNR